jgi:hypothetical protein
MAKGQSGNNAVGAKDIHAFLSSKGGIGKSFVASLLSQYAMKIGSPLSIKDMDSSNSTLANTKGLNAEQVNLLTQANFDHEKFDKVCEEMMSGEGPYLFDVGASMFTPVWGHLANHHYLDAWNDAGFRVIVHSVITGGAEAANTLTSLVDMAKAVPGRQIVVWLNPLHGEVKIDGKKFEEWKVYEQYKSKFAAVVELPLEDDAVKADLKTLGQKNGLLLDADKVEGLPFFSKHRLKVYREKVFSQIEPVWGAISGQQQQQQPQSVS